MGVPRSRVNASAAIKSFTIRGVSRSTARFFADSHVSAASLGTISLLNADFDNGDSKIVALDQAGTKEISKVAFRDTLTGTNWKWPVKPGTVFSGPADLIQLL